jgi:adenylate kinase family enzyme
VERIIVVGPSGSGKSTLASSIARTLGHPYVELDSLWWDAGWTEAGPERFRHRVDHVLGARWVVDGNYFSAGAREHIWPRADTIVWLDLPRLLTVSRVARRSARRVVRRTELWNGNRETVRNVLAADSVVRFAWTIHGSTRERYDTLQHDPDLAGLAWIRLASRAEVRRWQRSLARRAR